MKTERLIRNRERGTFGTATINDDGTVEIRFYGLETNPERDFFGYSKEGFEKMMETTWEYA